MSDAESNQAIIPIESISQSILLLRGVTVILDTDLARLYGVTTQRLNQQVRRNMERFPDDFMFQMTKQEAQCLKLQNATSKPGRGGRRTLPLVFTEHGALMVANVLNSGRAIEVSVYVVRAFIKIRAQLTNRDILSDKVEVHEERLDDHDAKIGQIIDAIRKLMLPPETPQRRIGFRSSENE